MTGRGIDQILRHPCAPTLYEGYVKSAIDYVGLAEAIHGPIPRDTEPAYIWGAALEELDRMRPDLRIINLETSITRNPVPSPKGINYRMSPENADCLRVAAVDCCVLANNHVLDWGSAGLQDTLATLDRLGIATAGAGRDDAQAQAPACLDAAGKGRVLVFSFATGCSGTPAAWAATRYSAGVNVLPDLSAQTAARVADRIAERCEPDDVVIASLHWGPNWGYEIPTEQRQFAHTLIDRAGVAVVHGHSSHHAKAIEIYRDRLVLYGCGDFLNDYEGISGHEVFRADLAMMYVADIDREDATLTALEIVPLQIRQFRLVHPCAEDVDWARRTLDRESQPFGTRVAPTSHGRLALTWARQATAPATATPPDRT